MLTKDGKHWIAGVSWFDIWFERWFHYDPIRFPKDSRRSSFILFFMPILLVFVGVGIPTATALSNSENSSHIYAYAQAGFYGFLALLSVAVGLCARRIENIPHWKVYQASGEYSRLELRLLMAPEVPNLRKQLWKHRILISNFLEDSGRTDTSDWGLDPERRPLELERRQNFIIPPVVTFLRAFGLTEDQVKKHVDSVMDELNRHEREHLADYIKRAQDGIQNAKELAYESERRVATYRQVESMMAAGQ